MNRKSFLSSLSGVAAACALQCFGFVDKPSVLRRFVEQKNKKWLCRNGNYGRIFYDGEIIVPSHGNHRYKLEWDSSQNLMIMQSLCSQEMCFPFDSPRGQFVAPYLEFSEWSTTEYGRRVICEHHLPRSNA